MRAHIGRTLPPAVAPIEPRNIIIGILAMFQGDRATKMFAEQLKDYFNVKHCFLLSSGKASLTLILQALKTLYPGRDEVLIPAFTCYSVPAAIIRAGLKIRVCDIEPETLDFDYCEFANLVNGPRLLCVVPTHLFGVTADIRRVRETVGNREIPIIEDAAQSMGAVSKGSKVGTLGDVGLFSLGRGKAFSTVSGGIILTDSDAIGNALNRQMKAIPEYSLVEQFILAIYAASIALFSRPRLFWIPKLLPFLGLGETHFDPDFPIKRMSAFQAGLSAGWQDQLIDLLRIRQENAEYLFRSGVKMIGGSELMSSGLIRFPIAVSSSAEKMDILRESSRSGLGGADVYPGTVDSIPELQGCIVGGTSGKARSMLKNMVTFPVHPYVTEADMDNIALLVREQSCKSRQELRDHID